jgi:uncharacterized RDD family membrane protein YckC
MSTAAAPAARSAGLLLRVAAMVYDGVLLFGIGFAVVLAVLLLGGAAEPAPIRRILLQVALFIGFGAYFSVCWSRTGQTLALKTWKLQLVDAADRPPALARAVARYVLAYSLALPGAAYIVWNQPSRAGGVAALAIGLLVMLVPALFDPQRRLLHDRWTGTRLIRLA